MQPLPETTHTGPLGEVVHKSVEDSREWEKPRRERHALKGSPSPGFSLGRGAHVTDNGLEPARPFRPPLPTSRPEKVNRGFPHRPNPALLLFPTLHLPPSSLPPFSPLRPSSSPTGPLYVLGGVRARSARDPSERGIVLSRDPGAYATERGVKMADEEAEQERLSRGGGGCVAELQRLGERLQELERQLRESQVSAVEAATEYCQQLCQVRVPGGPLPLPPS